MNTFRVLMIDDDVEWRDPFIENLQTASLLTLTGRPYDTMEIETATNQKEADEVVAQKQNGYYDLVLLDLRYPLVPDGQLPDEDAPESFQGMIWLPVLRRLQSKAAIVVLTSYATGNQLRDAVRAIRDFHANDFIPKTTSFDQVVCRISIACENARQMYRELMLGRQLRILVRSVGLRRCVEDIAAVTEEIGSLLSRIADRIEWGDPSSVKAAPNEIRAQVRALRDSVAGYAQDLSGGEKATRRVDVREMLRATIPLFEGWAAQVGATIHLADQESKAEIVTYAGDLMVALHEVISNALDALESSQIARGNRRLELSLKRGRDDVAIYIADNGDGIQDTAMEHMFSRDFTTKEDDRHQGIGLYLAKRMMHAIGGDIVVRNRPEGGAKVELLVKDLS